MRNPTLSIAGFESNPTNVWTLDTFDSPSSSGVLPTFRDSITLWWPQIGALKAMKVMGMEPTVFFSFFDHQLL